MTPKLQERVAKKNPEIAKLEAEFKDFRAGDIKHSLADISYIKERLGYKAGEGIEDIVNNKVLI